MLSLECFAKECINTHNEVKTMNEQNLKPIKKGQLTKEEAKERAKNGGKKSVEVRRAKKTLMQIFQAWADSETSETNKEILKTLKIDDKSNRATMLIPIINGIKAGNVKIMEMAFGLLNEDKRKDKEIEKLDAEIKKIKLENERLRKEINGDIETSQIIIMNDIPRGE